MQSSVVAHTIESPALGRSMPSFVVLPPGYAESQRRYPVLYLLHGWSGDHTNWTTLTNLVQYAAEYELIVVTPAGENSWYVNSATNPAGRFADYIVQDLIASIEAGFRAIAAPHRRAIAGLSMGGYGALLAASLHPELFAFAGSISGAFDGPCGIEDVLPELRESTDAAFGAPDSLLRMQCDLRNVLNAASAAALPYIYIACGAGDPLLASNRAIAAVLSLKEARYEYHERPGAHDWSFWDATIPHLLRSAARTVASG
jgi:putative tributyrin esterase